MEAIVLQLLSGLDGGSAYALIALGLTLIFGTLGVVNFAHGALFMIGAFCTVTLQRILTLSYTVIDDTHYGTRADQTLLQTPPRGPNPCDIRLGHRFARDHQVLLRCEPNSCPCP